MSLSLNQLLREFREFRRDDHIVVTTMSSAREWLTIENHPLDFVYAPSAMGQAPLVGLGLALAQPRKRVIVFNGDGCMLMNLGALISITASAPSNLVTIVLENGVYEVTGLQPTAASTKHTSSHEQVDFSAIARGAGFRKVHTIDDHATWRSMLPEILSANEPTFVTLRVAPVIGGAVPRCETPAVERARAFTKSLATM